MTNSKAPIQARVLEGNKGTFFRSIAEKAQAFTVDVNYNTNFSFTVPEGEYLLLGDDRLVSSDSRHVGTFKAKDITGRAKFRFWPITVSEHFKRPKRPRISNLSLFLS